MSDITLKQTDSGKTVHLASGETLSIELSEAAATGFRWVLPDVAPNLVHVSDQFTPGSLDSLGASGIHHFKLKAVRSGTTKLELKLRRAWDSPDDVSQIFNLTVVSDG